MKLKVRNLKWSTGNPIVFLEEETAKKLNVFVGNRVILKNKKEISGVVDITKGIIGKDEIGLSREVNAVLNTKRGDSIDVDILPVRESADHIRKKFNGEKLNEEEIGHIVRDIIDNKLSESEVAYFIAGQKLNGMDDEEVYHLTKSMVQTGDTLKFKGKCIADKHCIGGVAGNRTTPIVVSICAALGLTIPKTSSRAITSAAGTADVIETVANIELGVGDLKRLIRKEGGCLLWNSKIKLSPSDDKIIRIERILKLDIESQLVASVLSKKISMGSKKVIIDIPYGHGAKIENIKSAKKLRRLFLEIGKRFGLDIKVVFTDGRKPVGNGIGPVLEMKDVISVLKNDTDAPRDLKKKSLMLSTELLKLCGVKNAKRKALSALKSGEAYQKFVNIINAQNKKKDFEKRVALLVPAEKTKKVVGWSGGKIKRIDNKKINTVCRILGCPESKGAGVYLHKKSGRLKKGEKVITFYSESKEKLRQAVDYFWQEKAIEFG